MPDPAIILLHVPKTGGSTLRTALRWKYPSGMLFAESIYEPLERFGEIPLERRAAARVVSGHLHFGVHDYLPGEAVYVTMLREPVARVISMYHYIRSDPRHRLHGQLTAGMSLEEFVRTGADPGVDNHQTRMLAGVSSGVPGPELEPLGAAELALAKQNLERCLVAGVNERFDETFILMRRALGWRLPMYVSSKVASGPKPASDEARALIRERNLLDAELHAFARERLDAAIAAAGPTFAWELRAFKLLNRIPEAAGPRIPAPLRRRLRALLPR